MRLVDADKLPHCWQPGTNGDMWFVDGRHIEEAQTVRCGDCRFAEQTMPVDNGLPHAGPPLVHCTEAVMSAYYLTPDFGCSYFEPREGDNV